MKRIILAALVGMLVSGPAWGADEKGIFVSFPPGTEKCTEYLGATAPRGFESQPIRQFPNGSRRA